MEQRRKIFFLRHAERMDFNYGFKSWIQYCFDDSDEYIRSDLNMPYTLPKRDNGAIGYRMDTPLTQIGLFQGTLIGEGMRDHQIQIAHAFSSPGFRCIQTCDAILKGLNQLETTISIEPGLFEYLYLYKETPHWFTSNELKAAGYNINSEYVPLMSENTIKQNLETIEGYYRRSFETTKNIIDLSNRKGGGNILVVGHSSTLDVCTRQLTGLNPRPYKELYNLVQDIPYCSVAILEEIPESEKVSEAEWRLVDSKFLNFKHLQREEFDIEIIKKPHLNNRIIEKNKNFPLSKITGRD